MFTVKAGKNVIAGELRNFDLGGEDLVVRFALAGRESIECTFPKVPQILKESVGKMGLANLRAATLNLNNGTITIDKPLESTGKSMTEGKKRIQDARPRLKLGGPGQMVG